MGETITIKSRVLKDQNYFRRHDNQHNDIQQNGTNKKDKNCDTQNWVSMYWVVYAECGN
jgi:hypothetical protein